MDGSNWLQLERTVRFGDTDAAGVIQFHQLWRWCHEAYGESLERFGMAADEILRRPERSPRQPQAARWRHELKPSRPSPRTCSRWAGGAGLLPL